MRSCKNQVLIRCFLFWTSCIEYYRRTQQSLSNIFYYLTDYYYGYHDTWVFVSGHSVPISLNNFYNINHISWIYNNSTTVLEKASNDANKQYYKMSWLSAKIIVHPPEEEEQKEYDIDSFLSTFMVKTTNDSPPTLHNIFNAWCANRKQWFHPNSTIEFYVIDEMGEDHVFEILEHNSNIVLKQNKIYISDK
jgi:hypothetical protein